MQILTQAESRAHRIGQQNEVHVCYLLADGTADDYIWPMLLEKQQVLSEAGLSKDSFEKVEVSMEEKAPNSSYKVRQSSITSWANKPVTPSCTQISESLLMDDNDDLFLNIDIQE